MEHQATPKINKALEVQAELIAMLQATNEQFQVSKHPWADLASIGQVNKLLAEALGVIHGCEGSTVLENLKEGA